MDFSRLLWVVALLNYMDRQMLSTMRPSMQIDIHELQSATNFGYLMGIFLWMYGFMSPVSGIIADKVKPQMADRWKFVCMVWRYLCDGTMQLLLISFIGCAPLWESVKRLYIPAGLSLIADFHSDKTRSLAIGIHMTGLYLGQALGGFGATIAASFTWHLTFHIFWNYRYCLFGSLILFLREKKTELH